VTRWSPGFQGFQGSTHLEVGWQLREVQRSEGKNDRRLRRSKSEYMGKYSYLNSGEGSAQTKQCSGYESRGMLMEKQGLYA
jgi:hypothetical protein